MKITIETIPHSKQRYNTCGDWVFDPDGNIIITVSDTGNWKYNACVAVHELIEVLACKASGVSQQEVDDFDINWKPNFGFLEPGEDPRSPYFAEHALASRTEETLFDFICEQTPIVGTAWDDYEKKIKELGDSRE